MTSYELKIRIQKANEKIQIEIVREVAETLGENEDFDGLISSLKDYARIY
jgi:hypothetical protein